MSWTLSLFLNALALLAADWLLDGIQISGVLWVIVSALVLAVVNTLIRPILLAITLPLTVVTLGLFIFIVNALTFALTAFLVPGFHIYSFGAAFWGAITTSLVSWLLNHAFNSKR